MWQQETGENPSTLKTCDMLSACLGSNPETRDYRRQTVPPCNFTNEHIYSNIETEMREFIKHSLNTSWDWVESGNFHLYSFKCFVAC